MIPPSTRCKMANRLSRFNWQWQSRKCKYESLCDSVLRGFNEEKIYASTNFESSPVGGSQKRQAGRRHEPKHCEFCSLTGAHQYQRRAFINDEYGQPLPRFVGGQKVDCARPAAAVVPKTMTTTTGHHRWCVLGTLANRFCWFALANAGRNKIPFHFGVYQRGWLASWSREDLVRLFSSSNGRMLQ